MAITEINIRGLVGIVSCVDDVDVRSSIRRRVARCLIIGVVDCDRAVEYATDLAAVCDSHGYRVVVGSGIGAWRLVVGCAGECQRDRVARDGAGEVLRVVTRYRAAVDITGVAVCYRQLLD